MTRDTKPSKPLMDALDFLMNRERTDRAARPDALERYSILACDCDDCAHAPVITTDPGGRWVRASDAAETIEALTAERERLEAELEAVAKAIGAERDDFEGAPWYVPAEPGPVECNTLAEAVAAALRLPDRTGDDR
jgi:hypothetical protein